MDIDKRLSLRTFEKPEVNTLVTTLILAMILHVVLVIYLDSKPKYSNVKMSEWVNIKLVAGFEEAKRKNPPESNTETNTGDKREIQRNIENAKRLDQTGKKANVTVSDKKESTAASATTIIKANSLPYLYENSKPVYPAAARKRGIQGVVLLNVEVTAKGWVNKINILQSSGFRILDVAAMNSVARWRFAPGSRDGVNIMTTVTIPVRFSLQETNS